MKFKIPKEGIEAKMDDPNNFYEGSSRKIIQISSTNILGISTDEPCNYKIFALCADGILREKMYDAFHGGYSSWSQINPIGPSINIELNEHD